MSGRTTRERLPARYGPAVWIRDSVVGVRLPLGLREALHISIGLRAVTGSAEALSVRQDRRAAKGIRQDVIHLETPRAEIAGAALAGLQQPFALAVGALNRLALDKLAKVGPRH